MTRESRLRLARITRTPSADLAEAALLCCVEAEPDLDVDAELLRLDALADRMRTQGFTPGSAEENARALSRYLAGDLGFAGETDCYHDPSNGLLTRVLDRRRGLPITLSIVYIAIAERLDIPAFGVNAPGHFLVAVGASGLPTTGMSRHPAAGIEIIDAFHRGAILSVPDVDERVRVSTSGLGRFDPEMLRPPPPATIIRRLLNNLTRDFLGEGDVESAVWTLELKRLLPDSGEDDVRALAELLVQIGRYRQAAESIEDYLGDEVEAASAVDLGRVAVRARAKMN
jgi:regulator of sirC expression with transglutaminase-like and TPR domain